MYTFALLPIGYNNRGRCHRPHIRMVACRSCYYCSIIFFSEEFPCGVQVEQRFLLWGPLFRCVLDPTTIGGCLDQAYNFLATAPIGFVHNFQLGNFPQLGTPLSSFVIGPRFECVYKLIHTQPYESGLWGPAIVVLSFPFLKNSLVWENLLLGSIIPFLEIPSRALP